MSEQLAEELLDKNIFMICDSLNRNALRDLPPGFHARHCRKDELDLWKAFPFDTKLEATHYRPFMDDFYDRVYADNEAQFFKQCLFVCDAEDRPVATGFIWRTYNKFNTFNWLKVRKEFEDRGIGRALVSILMQDLSSSSYPIYLHTQLGSYRAIKLYSDFGFKLLSDPVIGRRTNDLQDCWPHLKSLMPEQDFAHLSTVSAPSEFIDVLAEVDEEHF